MSDLDFYADLLATGEILGLGLGSGPESWVELLGEDYVENAERKQSHRDFGPIATSFYRSEGRWICESIRVRVHQLSPHSSNRVEMPPRIPAEFGAFSPVVRFDDLVVELSRRGVTVEQRTGQRPMELVQYSVPETRASVSVVADAAFASAEGRNVGDVWSLSGGDVVVSTQQR